MHHVQKVSFFAFGDVPVQTTNIGIQILGTVFFTLFSLNFMLILIFYSRSTITEQT